jgi:hypothetical protein
VRCFADQRSTVAVACGHKRRGHVAAKERDVRHMHAIADAEGAARIVVVAAVAECRVRAETDIRKVDGVLAVETSHRPRKARGVVELERAGIAGKRLRRGIVLTEEIGRMQRGQEGCIIIACVGEPASLLHRLQSQSMRCRVVSVSNHGPHSETHGRCRAGYEWCLERRAGRGSKFDAEFTLMWRCRNGSARASLPVKRAALPT